MTMRPRSYSFVRMSTEATRLNSSFQTYELKAANDEQPEWLVGNVGDIRTALEGDHVVCCGDHDWDFQIFFL